MKSICVIGAGEAGINFIKKIRESGNECGITFIERKKSYSRKSELFECETFQGKRKAVYFDSEFCRDYSVKYINANVERINPDTRKIFFKDCRPIEFDTLVISSGAVSKSLSIKGDFRGGFFYLSDIDSLKLKDCLSISNDIAVYASTILGIRLSLSLSAIKKEVKFISENLDFLGRYKERFLNLLERRNIDVYLNCHIEEAIGESRVKAVRVSLPKIFSSQSVFIDSGFSTNTGFFDADLIIRNSFFTNYKDIYIIGDASNEDINEEKFFFHNAKRAYYQSCCLADYITYDKLPDNHCENNFSYTEESYIENILKE